MKMVISKCFEAVEITNISNNFTIMPQKFLVFGYNNNHVWTETVLSGDVNNKPFNCGTMLEKIVPTTVWY